MRKRQDHLKWTTITYINFGYPLPYYRVNITPDMNLEAAGHSYGIPTAPRFESLGPCDEDDDIAWNNAVNYAEEVDKFFDRFMAELGSEK